MNAVEIYEKASWDLEHNKITLGEFEERIRPLYDVEPVRHGHWLLDPSGAEFCSECGEYPFDDGEYHISGWSSKYCPNCGAKMDGEEQEHGDGTTQD